MSKFLLAVGLAILMAVTGVSSYVYLGTRQSKAAAPIQKPTAATPRAQAFALPGTIYLAQAGALYSFSAGRFHQLTPEVGWTQPALYPDGSHLLAVKRSGFFSDVYVLTPYGGVVGQLTNNAASPRNAWDTGANAWSFYPRLSPDQRTLWMSYDGPKYAGAGYFDVDMAVWAVPVGGSIQQGRAWTVANNYTGGDMQPIVFRAASSIRSTHTTRTATAQGSSGSPTEPGPSARRSPAQTPAARSHRSLPTAAASR